LNVPARDALLLPLNIAVTPLDVSTAKTPGLETFRLPLRTGSFIATKSPNRSFNDGYPEVLHHDAAMIVAISPCAGARVFVFADAARSENLFTTVGGLRDAWTPALPPSPRDYIAKYTHPIATGTFNRCYRIRKQPRGITLSYEAPDAPGGAARFEKSVTFGDREFDVALRSTFRERSERAQQLSSFAFPAGAQVLRMAGGYAIYEPAQHRVVMAVWPSADVADARFDVHTADALLTLTYTGGGVRHTRYGFTDAASLAQAQARFAAFANPR
jgi:hypothetical protein